MKRHVPRLQSTRPRYISLLTLGAATLALVGYTIVGTTTPGSIRAADRYPPGTVLVADQSPSSSWSVSYPFTLPAGYQPPTGMATDPHDAGVWLFAQRLTPNQTVAETVFHWADGKLSTYDIDTSNSALLAGAQTPMVVDAHNIVWVGVNRNVLRIDPVAMEPIQTLPLPDVPTYDNSSGLPSPPVQGAEAEGFTSVDSIALVDDTVMIGRRFSTVLQSMDLSTLQVTDIPLPQNTELAGLDSDLAGNSQGPLYVVLYNRDGSHELAQYGSHRWLDLTVNPCPAYAARVSGAQVIVSGADCVARGAATTSGSPTQLATVTSSQRRGTAISADAFLVWSNTESDIVDQNGKATDRPALGQVVVVQHAAPMAQRSASTPVDHTLVPITPGLTASNGNGSLWFIPAQGGSSVGLISAASEQRN